MKVTPIKRKFGKYAPGDVFELKDRSAKLLIRVGKLAAAPDVPVAPVASAPAPEPVVDPVADEAESPSRMREALKNLPAYETRMLTADVPATPARRPYVRRNTTTKND